MKKLLVSLLAIFMLVTMSAPVFAATTEPVISTWAKTNVELAIKNGYVPEELQNNYQKPITREEFAKLMVTAIFADFNDQYKNYSSLYKKRVWGIQSMTPEVFMSKVSTTQEFADTDSEYIKVANMLGILNPVDDKNNFNPDGKITKEQLAEMIANYAQTYTGDGITLAPKEVADLGKVSEEYLDAVLWAYGADFMRDASLVKYKKVNGYSVVDKKANFNPKRIISREEAIFNLAKLGQGPDSRFILENLILRGYVSINLDDFMSGFEIDGDTIKKKKSGYDFHYSAVKQNLRYSFANIKEYAEKATTEQLNAAFKVPLGAQYDGIHESAYLDKILSGKETLYDYGVFTIEHNKDGYLSIITKKDFPGFFHGGRIALSYVPGGLENPELVQVIGKEIK